MGIIYNFRNHKIYFSINIKIIIYINNHKIFIINCMKNTEKNDKKNNKKQTKNNDKNQKKKKMKKKINDKRQEKGKNPVENFSLSSSSSSENYRTKEGRVISEGIYSKKKNLNSKNLKKVLKSNNNVINNKVPINKESKDLPYMDYIEIDIEKDGNCYYRCLSYYYRKTQDYHLEFRKFISEIFENNLDKFKDHYPDPNILGIPEPASEDEIIDLLNLYLEKMKQPEFYAGDQELAITSHYLNININVLIKGSYNYKSLYYYESPQKTNEVINLLYINGNHYQLLYKIKDINEESENAENKDIVNINDFIEEKSKEIENKKDKLDKYDINFPEKIIITSKYMDYIKPQVKNKYNEIYNYLLNNNNMPERLEYKNKLKYKSIQKKRTAFRNQANNNYCINNKRLCFKYKLHEEEKKLFIPFLNEDKIILNNIHISNHHPGINKMKELIIENGYYWEGYSQDIINFMKSCPICHPQRIHKKINMPIKQIIDEGPHYRYQADIWYLDKELKNNTQYEYCLDIVDHFSKWAYSYLLVDKSMSLVLSKIKLYILNFGKCKIFQTDNGTEFKNKELKLYLEKEDIKQVFSRPYHPQSNGAVEALHKSVRKFLMNELKIKKKRFNLEIALEEFIIFHNNTTHSITKRKPIEIKDIEDQDEINEINMNIIKSISRKIKDEPNISKYDLLLLCDNIKVNKDTIVLDKKHSKKIYNIPCRFISYKNSSLVTIIVDINYKNLLLKGEEYTCDYHLLNIVEDFAYNYYLKINNKEIGNEDDEELNSVDSFSSLDRI